MSSKVYVEDIIVSSDVRELQEKINNIIDKFPNKDVNIISVMFIGNNKCVQRIYQIVYTFK